MEYGKDRIFPVLKNYEYVLNVSQLLEDKNKNKKENLSLVYEKLNDALYVFYVFDTERSIRFMTKEDLKKLDVRESELMALSKRNLKKLITSVTLEGDPAAVSMLVADGTYEASFLLFDDLWSKEQFPVKGDIVVYVPSRDLVLITGSKDKEGLAKVHDIVYNPDNEWSYVVAEKGFIREGNKWAIFKP